MKKNRLLKFILKLLVASVIAVVIGLALGFKWYFDTVANLFLPTKPVLTNSADKQSVKILFIGNSLTFCNLMPYILAKFIESDLHRPTKIYQCSVPGETLQGHWNRGTAQLNITKSGPWDYVVLQGASAEPRRERQQKALYEYGRRFDDVIKSVQAKSILFETWADKKEPQAQQGITAVYNNLSRQTGALVVPVGQSFVYVEANDKGANLYATDNHHPSQAGSYVAACLFYYFLFDKKPSKTLPNKIVFHDEHTKKDYPVLDLDEEQASALQNSAWKFYLSQKVGS